MARMRATDRRRQLLEVAAEQFARYGYRGTTTAQLAKAARITEPILYRHFDNKLDLFITLIGEVGREVIASWEAALEEADNPEQRLETLLAGNPATHERGRSIYRVIFQAMTECEGEPEIAAAIRKHVNKLYQFVRTELAELQKQKAVRSDEPVDALAWMLVHVAIGYGMVAPLGMPRHASASGRNVEHLLGELLTAE
jgi:AcrR family transcriptional regulator